jgi:hypothetical protein
MKSIFFNNKKKFIVLLTLVIVIMLGWYWLFVPKNDEERKIKEVTQYGVLSGKPAVIAYFAEYFLQTNDKEYTFLVLLQNDNELRPGGGYIGTFGIVKVKNGRITHLDTHNSNVFDGRVPPVEEPPYPMAQTLNIGSHQLRDSNWWPDFPTNAQKAEYFYHLGDGQEEFDGIIAITTDVFTQMLEITGPINVEEYDLEFTTDNGVEELQYFVWKGYKEYDIEKGNRKKVITRIAEEMKKKVGIGDPVTTTNLALEFLDSLNQKDIQLYFKDPELQKRISVVGWSGEFAQEWNKDFIYLVDANLGSLKTDQVIERSLEYRIDLRGPAPAAELVYTYNHTAQEKSLEISDYQTYLRLYVPKEAYISSVSDAATKPVYASEMGKKYIGVLVQVDIGEKKEMKFQYTLPEDVKENYNLLIQKQAGVEKIPTKITIIHENGEEEIIEHVLLEDQKLSELR